jgi:CRISPR-associated endonuclease/helicase Cas3
MSESDSLVWSEFRDFFRQATRKRSEKSADGFSYFDPYPFQQKLAVGETLPNLVCVPTGLGKTEAVFLAWLWRRRFASNEVRERTPRRLVYCLPMRVLVEQTEERIISILKNLGLSASHDSINANESASSARSPRGIPVTILMGGEYATDWDMFPEIDQVIIGTQDMLLSRALNRGYGMSRYRWPLHCGLLNNDSLWILDEPQLMGVGMVSSAQLHWLRNRLGSIGNPSSIWMSATASIEWLRTIDMPKDQVLIHTAISEEDRQNAQLSQRLQAKKEIVPLGIPWNDSRALGEAVAENHEEGTISLVIVNTVKMAREVHSFLSKKKPKTILLHSQYRPGDRKGLIDEIIAIQERIEKGEPENGAVVVSTQVVEAGVDISCKRLFVQASPYASFVQRLGRCNRKGEYEVGAKVYIATPEEGVGEKDQLPYVAETISKCNDIVKPFFGKDISSSELPQGDFGAPFGITLRRKDMLELFDTTPDIMGNDVDISRFIRETRDMDVQVFWRDFREDTEGQDPPGRNEICPAPLSEVKNFLDRGGKAYHWDFLDGQWVEARSSEILPGSTIMLRSIDGAYDSLLGWAPHSKKSVPEISQKTTDTSRDQEFGDRAPPRDDWKDLSEHTQEVIDVVSCFILALHVPEIIRPKLIQAARWHDSGKAHPSFQARLTDPPPRDPSVIWAKAPKKAWKVLSENSEERRTRMFRHEVVSGLLYSKNSENMDPLIRYLVASHHGKVRVSLRPLPDEGGAAQFGGRKTRGVREGDVVEQFDLLGQVIPKTTLDLSLMELGRSDGRPSWSEAALMLVNDPGIGPFRLTFYEALIKAADERASSGVK